MACRKAVDYLFGAVPHLRAWHANIEMDPLTKRRMIRPAIWMEHIYTAAYAALWQRSGITSPGKQTEAMAGTIASASCNYLQFRVSKLTQCHAQPLYRISLNYRLHTNGSGSQLYMCGWKAEPVRWWPERPARRRAGRS